MLLVTPTISVKGYGSLETGQVIARARAIAEKVGEARQLFPVMYGEWAFNLVSGRIQASRQLAEQYVRVAQQQADTVPLLVGHRMLGTSFASVAELSLAREQFERALALYDPQLHKSSAFIYGTGLPCLFANLPCAYLAHPGCSKGCYRGKPESPGLRRRNETSQYSRRSAVPSRRSFSRNMSKPTGGE